MMKNFLLPLLCSLLILGCQPDPALERSPLSIQFHTPQGWPIPVYNFANNPLTTGGFELGRRLFYDPRLSSDNSTSCGSCHQQFAGFAHADHGISHGVQNRIGKRNSPGVFNMAWHSQFFWDGGVNHLELQPINPIENPVEMDLSLADMIKKLQGIPEYKTWFKDAFGTEEINDQRALRAMALFMALMISDNSKYDKISRGEPGMNYSAEENRGLQVFSNNCASCHKAPLFTDLSFRNNGLAVNPAINDSGRAIITLAAEDMYTFKVPSLRNLSYTQPYMHDGRLKTIDQVLDHYEKGIVQSPTLDSSLKNGITLTATERSDLKAFLKTLDDPEFLVDKRFSEPKF